ncbi:MAG TPA: hypothetical protein PLC40_10355 [Candidatus Hydrogenedentes bacterium]|nr:hypothetical protein [Candidatus Hydrogenedentota bacterium]
MGTKQPLLFGESRSRFYYAYLAVLPVRIRTGGAPLCPGALFNLPDTGPPNRKQGNPKNKQRGSKGLFEGPAAMLGVHVQGMGPCAWLFMKP